jgi:myb proto-oncogene protein
VRKRLDEYNGVVDLQVPVHVIHNDLKQVARLPPAENHMDLNKGPNISLRNIKGCSDFLSLSLPTAQPVTSCEASVADTIMGLKMDSGHDKDRKLNFVCEKGLEINLLHDKGLEIDLVTNKLGHSEPAKSEGDRASFGSLCYQIPKLEDTDLVHSPVFSKHHGPKNHGDGFQSPTGYTTPSLRDGTKSDQLSVESILKSAAENFPGTPSILRRRKREKPTPAQDSDFKIDTNSDAFDTPIGICTTDSPRSFKTAAFLSLGHLDDQRLPAVMGKVDVSPAYRPRSKRMAVLKTIEKHLDFSSDAMAICDTARILKSACWNSESINPGTGVSSVQNKKMAGHITGLETLTSDIAQTTKLGAT